jgi:hypothetical protein
LKRVEIRLAWQLSFRPLSDRNAGLELFRRFTLLNAHQWHLGNPFCIDDFPDTHSWRRYYVASFVSLCFTMSGLFQIGSLFLLIGLFAREA